MRQYLLSKYNEMHYILFYSISFFSNVDDNPLNRFYKLLIPHGP